MKKIFLILVFSVLSAFAEEDFDKTVCGLALLDSAGNVIYGKIPSVSECRSYESPAASVDVAWEVSR